MSDIYQHLGLKRDIFDHFALQASLVVDNKLRSGIERHIRSLSKIAEQHLVDSQAVAPKDAVDKVLLKVKRLSRLLDETYEWTAFELRIIAYNLGSLKDSSIEFRYAVNLLDKQWRNIFFGGITFYVLENWLPAVAGQKDIVCEILKRKLEKYDGDNRRIKVLKNHADYFDSNGPLRLATLLLQKNKPIMEAPELLGYKENAISFSYFSDVILYYFSQKGTIETGVLEEVLTYHSLDRTKKLALANLVSLAEKEGKEYVQTQVCKFAQRILGDIALSSTWTPFPNASEEEIGKLRKAQALVNQWNARKAINTFFELCVQDSKRKELWLKYVPFIYDFRIVGSKATKTKLLSDDRVANLIESYFITTKSSRRQTSALVLYISNKVLVEFSDKGALYIYNRTHTLVSEIRKGRVDIDGVEDLKLPSLNLLIDGFEGAGNWYEGYESSSWIKYHDEGRLLHSDYWRERINAWMRQHLKIDYRRPENYKDSLLSFDYVQSDNSKPQDSLENKPLAVSKLIFAGICRVEGYKDGVYLRITNSNKLVLLASIEWNSGDSIWIKKDRSFLEVYIHARSKNDYLGFLSYWGHLDKKIIFHPLSTYGSEKIEIPLC